MFNVGSIIFHPQHRVGVVQRVCGSELFVAFVAADDQWAHRSEVLSVEHYFARENYIACRKLRDEIREICAELILNSVGVFVPEIQLQTSKMEKRIPKEGECRHFWRTFECGFCARSAPQNSAQSDRKETERRFKLEQMWRTRRHISIWGFECTPDAHPADKIPTTLPSEEWDEDFAEWVAEHAAYPAIAPSKPCRMLPRSNWVRTWTEEQIQVLEVAHQEILAGRSRIETKSRGKTITDEQFEIVIRTSYNMPLAVRDGLHQILVIGKKVRDVAETGQEYERLKKRAQELRRKAENMTSWDAYLSGQGRKPRAMCEIEQAQATNPPPMDLYWEGQKIPA